MSDGTFLPAFKPSDEQIKTCVGEARYSEYMHAKHEVEALKEYSVELEKLQKMIRDYTQSFGDASLTYMDNVSLAPMSHLTVDELSCNFLSGFLEHSRRFFGGDDDLITQHFDAVSSGYMDILQQLCKLFKMHREHDRFRYIINAVEEDVRSMITRSLSSDTEFSAVGLLVDGTVSTAAPGRKPRKKKSGGGGGGGGGGDMETDDI